MKSTAKKKPTAELTVLSKMTNVAREIHNFMPIIGARSGCYDLSKLKVNDYVTFAYSTIISLKEIRLKGVMCSEIWERLHIILPYCFGVLAHMVVLDNPSFHYVGYDIYDTSIKQYDVMDADKEEYFLKLFAHWTKMLEDSGPYLSYVYMERILKDFTAIYVDMPFIEDPQYFKPLEFPTREDNV